MGLPRFKTKSELSLLIPCSIEFSRHQKKDLHIRQIMDESKVLLVNLAKGRIGEDSSSLLGGLLVTTIGLAAFSRSDVPPSERRDFFVYVDEFQSFTTLSLANMLSEL